MRKLLFFITLLVLLQPLAALAAPQKTVRVGVRPFSPPFCFYKDSGSKPQIRGVAVDLLKVIEKIAPYEFQFIPSADISHRRELLEQGNIDVMAFGMIPSGPGRRGLYIPVHLEIQRRLFVNASCKTIVCNDDLLNKKVAVIMGDDFGPFVANVQPQDIFVMRTPEEALKLLNNGDVDAFLSPSEITAMYIIQKEKLENIIRVGVVLQTTPLALELRPDSVELHAHLTAAVAKLDRDGVIAKIRDKWYGVALQPSTLQRYSQAILLIAGVFLAVLFTFLLWNYHLKSRIRRVTRDLGASELKYRNLIESSPDMIFVVDIKGQIKHANKKANSILPPSDSMDRCAANLVDLIVSEQQEGFLEFLKSVLNPQNSSTREFRFVDAPGHTREMDVAATRILSEHTDGPLICCFARDVTERNRIERELVQADRLATIGQMAAGVAHEINNPIGIVQANIELILARGWFTEEAREFLESIRRNIVRAGRITQDLLSVAKPKNPEMSEVDLHELVLLTTSMLAVQLKGIEIEHQPPPNHIRIWGDSHLLQHVMVNVLLNAQAALQDRPKGRIRITYCTPSGESATCLRIEDNGKGIPREYLNEVFEPFFNYGKKEGFGLGLFISRRIIERHNGIIFAESESGKGTQILIELPLRALRHSPTEADHAEPTKAIV
ncbi:MAG: transporter substrate-binding domain-containing protein [Deltaproteobacteria bacterium]|nr:transporter substrate-binding domain-containing protein [Deltaproteobacteria bacterium]